MGFQHMDPARRLALSRKGGQKTRERMLAKDPDYYLKRGKEGAEALIHKYGGMEQAKAHFSEIGKRHGSRKEKQS